MGYKSTGFDLEGLKIGEPLGGIFAYVYIKGQGLSVPGYCAMTDRCNSACVGADFL